jgi:hypothetical protein
LGSNVNDDREVQEAKHEAPRISTDDGMQIDFNDLQQENA